MKEGFTLNAGNIDKFFTDMKSRMGKEISPAYVICSRIRKGTYKGKGRPKKSDYLTAEEIANILTSNQDTK